MPCSLNQSLRGTYFDEGDDAEVEGGRVSSGMKSLDVLKTVLISGNQLQPKRVCGSIIVLRGEGDEMETLVGQIECVNTLRSTSDVLVCSVYQGRFILYVLISTYIHH